MLSRKHYEAIAEMIVNTTQEYELLGDSKVRWLAKKPFVNWLADYFAKDNPHFDRERFLTACGLIE